MCRASGQFELNSEEFTLEFDYTSFVGNLQTGDSVPVFVKRGGDGTNAWKFTYFSDTLEEAFEQECSDTDANGVEFVALIENFLFLTNSAGAYLVCKMDLDLQSTTSLPTLILAPPYSEVTGTITTFIPYWR